MTEFQKTWLNIKTKKGKAFSDMIHAVEQNDALAVLRAIHAVDALDDRCFLLGSAYRQAITRTMEANKND